VVEGSVGGEVSGAGVERPFERLCRGPCGRWRSLGWFAKKGSARLDTWCRDCRRPQRVKDRAVRRSREAAAGKGLPRITSKDLERMNERQGWRCACGCGRSTRYDWEPDHVIAIARGGRHELGNLRILAPICNRRKGAR